MPVIRSEFACPQCDKQGVVTQISASETGVFCDKGHKWNDTAVFASEHPRRAFKPVMPKIIQQDNHTSITVRVPIRLQHRLQEAYGDKMEATVVSILNSMAEGNAMIVPETDVQRIGDKLGKRPENSSELYGMIFSCKAEVDDMRTERDSAVKDLKAYEGLSVGRVVVDLGPNFSSAQAKASEANLPLKIWTERMLANAIENNWF